MTDDQGKRSSRQQFTAKVRLKVSGEDDIAERYAQNLSDGGMFVRHDSPPEVGSVILLEFLLPDGRPLCRVAAEVVHARAALSPGQKTAGMGLRFVKLDSVAGAIVDSFRQRSGKGAPQPEPEALSLEGAVGRIDVLKHPGPPPMLAVEGPVVGIDLGTSNSCVAIMENERPRVITSAEGYETIPSVMFVDEDDRVFIGHKATERMILKPDRAVYGSKRFLGRPFASREVRTMGHFFAYDLVEGEGGSTAARIGNHVLRLEEVAAHILGSLKKMAESHLGRPILRAVITTPAYFGETQRQAVRDAGRLAGFYVERVLNEPTAAAVAYGYGRGLKRTVLVYDLGGGTFDASILRIEGDRMEVLATDGDPFLGGSDFDDRLTEYVLKSFEKSHGMSVREDPVAIQRIRFAAEMAKRQLSEATTAEIDLPYLAVKGSDHIDLRLKLTRELLESLTHDLVDRTLRIVEAVLKQAKLHATDLDDVLLVGGQTRSPQVRELIVQRFGREPAKSIHPEEAVARGAAIIAGAIQQSLVVQLVDILPASIRMGLPSGRTRVLLPRGTRLPSDTEFDIEVDGGLRAGLRLTLYRGESENADENTFLGMIAFPPLASSAAASARGQAKLAISHDGLMTVSARHPLTGEVRALDVSLQDV